MTDNICDLGQALTRTHPDACQKAIGQLDRYATVESDHEIALAKVDEFLTFSLYVYPHAPMDTEEESSTIDSENQRPT